MTLAATVGIGKEGRAAIVNIAIPGKLAAEPAPKLYPFLPWDASMGYHPDGMGTSHFVNEGPLRARRDRLVAELAEVDRQLAALAKEAKSKLGPLPDRLKITG